MKRDATYPRKKQHIQAIMPFDSIKATKKGAIHWVGAPGTGGAARRFNRQRANLG